MDNHVVILGAGPAGLSAAYELSGRGVPVTVVEADAVVGGLARTESYKGYRFDIGGHRFFTHMSEVDRLWHSLMGEDLIRVARLSRIYYNGRYFYYPLRPWNALAGLGLLESTRVTLSYLRARLFPTLPEDTYEAYVSNRFGRRLFQLFFQTYTEKVWGIPTHEIRAEWAAQRMKDVSFSSAVLNALFPARRTLVKSLIQEFEYPRHGPGMVWERVCQAAEAKGACVLLNAPVVAVNRKDGRIASITVQREGGPEVIQGTHFISTLALRDLVARFDSPPPEEVKRAAAGLKFRDFLHVILIVNRRELFPDNWLYVHTPGVQVGRIQNFKNWSAEMTPDANMTSLGLEYFVTEGDELWSRSDDELIELGKRELALLKLAEPAQVIDGTVKRMRRAYPVYDSGYRENLNIVRGYLNSLANLQTIGRNGLHKYNNQDHSIMTGLLAARNLCGERHDLWSVPTDLEYQEEIRFAPHIILEPVEQPEIRPEPADVSIVVPVLNGGQAFVRCLQALAELRPAPGEIIVVDDGSTDLTPLQARQAEVQCLSTARPRSGPAVARNLGAAHARGQLVFFVDADVRVKPDAVARICQTFRGTPGLAALYGSYDDTPAEPNFISQYKNLMHHYVHQDASGGATSFWAGCGAIRRDVFGRLEGFSAEYQAPSIEDIELGYRLKKAGYSSRLVKHLQVTHLKRWTFGSLLDSDIRARALPWTRLILRDREFPADLNLKFSSRISVAAVFGLLLSLPLALFSPQALLVSAACALGLLLLNWRVYRYFAARRGLGFALASIPLHWLYYLYSGLAFLFGLTLWLKSARSR